jgi:hypothetical protein
MRRALAYSIVITDAVVWSWGDAEAVDSRTPGFLVVRNPGVMIRVQEIRLACGRIYGAWS